MAHRTYDQLALDILMDKGSEKQKKARFTKLMNHAKGRLECPECGDMGPHDDNGHTGEDRSYCCNACGSHFDDPGV